MSERLIQPGSPQKPPLFRLQAHLVALKECIRLLREVCVELKDLLAIITIILFFVLGVYEALNRLVVQPHWSEEQSISKPLDQAHR